jgi:hypothetical protein
VSTTGPEGTATAGYSGTPLHRKLGIAPGARVLALGVPQGWDLGRLDPDGVASVHTRAGSAPYDVAVIFCPDFAALRRRLPQALPRVTEKGRLWACWPKQASGVPTDLTDNEVRRFGLAAGVVDVKVCAVDATWSALCFMTRLRDRSH